MPEVALLRNAFVNLYFSLLQVLQVLQDGSPPFSRAPRAEYKKKRFNAHTAGIVSPVVRVSRGASHHPALLNVDFCCSRRQVLSWMANGVASRTCSCNFYIAAKEPARTSRRVRPRSSIQDRPERWPWTSAYSDRKISDRVLYIKNTTISRLQFC